MAATVEQVTATGTAAVGPVPLPISHRSRVTRPRHSLLLLLAGDGRAPLSRAPRPLSKPSRSKRAQAALRLRCPPGSHLLGFQQPQQGTHQAQMERRRTTRPPGRPCTARRRGGLQGVRGRPATQAIARNSSARVSATHRSPHGQPLSPPLVSPGRLVSSGAESSRSPAFTRGPGIPGPGCGSGRRHSS